MGSKRLYQTEGIVIQRRDHGEADRILTLCTPSGKLAVIAKGARLVRSRKAGHLELFVRAHLGIARSRSSWDVVSQADTVEPHIALRDDLARGTYARYVAELYNRFVADGEGGPDLYDLLCRTLRYLGDGKELDLLVRAYEQRVLALVGFRPEWRTCVGEREQSVCRRALEVGGADLFGLDAERGGAVCPECYEASRGRRDVIPLSPAVLQLLRACGRESFERLKAYPTTPVVLEEAAQAARHYITYYLERDVWTDTFIQRLKRERTSGLMQDPGHPRSL